MPFARKTTALVLCACFACATMHADRIERPPCPPAAGPSPVMNGDGRIAVGAAQPESPCDDLRTKPRKRSLVIVAAVTAGILASLTLILRSGCPSCQGSR